MTKVQNPIIGRAKGSAGGMTFSKNSDQNVMRAKAFEVNNPKTTAQTTQRDFFKEVQSIVDSVSPEQLRSLFGDKPKKMSRRNALFKQVAAAYSVDGTTKSVDFSKLLTIGNGEKIDVEILHVDSNTASLVFSFANNPGLAEMPIGANVILVFFLVETKTIKIVNTEDIQREDRVDFDFSGEFPDFGEFYVYPTYATNGKDVSQRGFGSFIIKTRKEK